MKESTRPQRRPRDPASICSYFVRRPRSQTRALAGFLLTVAGERSHTVARPKLHVDRDAAREQCQIAGEKGVYHTLYVLEAAGAITVVRHDRYNSGSTAVEVRSLEALHLIANAGAWTPLEHRVWDFSEVPPFPASAVSL